MKKHDQISYEHSARAQLWTLSHNMIGSLIDNLTKLPSWDTKTLYLCSQLNTMAIISGTLKLEKHSINVAGILKSRILIDCVNNCIAALTEESELVNGVSEPSFVDMELRKLKIPLAERKLNQGHHKTQFKRHGPDKWKHTKEPEGLVVKYIGNSLIHADADAGYNVRLFHLRATDVKALSLAVTVLVQETNAHLESVGAGLSQKAYDDYIEKLKELLPRAVAEVATYTGEFSPFEERLYKELSRYNPKMGIIKNEEPR